MINVKAATIRYGLSRFWQSKLHTNSYHLQSLSVYLNKFFSEIFMSREFIKAGLTYDFSVFHFTTNSLSVDVFLQDSMNEEIRYITRSKNSKLFNFLFYKHVFFKKKSKPRIFSYQSPPNFYKATFNKPFARFTKRRFRLPRKIFRFYYHFSRRSLSFSNFKSFFRFLQRNYKNRVQNLKFKLPVRRFAYFFKLFLFKFFSRKLFFPVSFSFKNMVNFIFSNFKNFNNLLPPYFFKTFYSKKNYKTITRHSRKLFLSISSKKYNIFFNPNKISRFFNADYFTYSSRPKRLKYLRRFKSSKTFLFKSYFSNASKIFNLYSKILKTFLVPFFQLKHLRIYRSKYTLINVNAFVFYSSVKLYYKYMLNDVIKPIIRGASMYYSGFFVLCKGRFTRAQIASKRLFQRNFVNYNRTYRPIYYGMNSVALRYGASTVHIWIQP